jgi:hypothetical protein
MTVQQCEVRVIWWMAKKFPAKYLQQLSCLTSTEWVAFFVPNDYTSSQISGLFPPIPVTSHSCCSTSQWAFSLLIISLGILFGFVIIFTSYLGVSTFPKDLLATFIYDVANNAPNTIIM